VDAYPVGLVAIAPDNTIGFCGYVFNTEVATGGLYTVRHRHYMPDIGRWLERDPAGFVDGANLYEYGMSSPSVRNDPMGLWSDHARETLDNTKEKYCEGLRKDYCKGKITEEQYAQAVDDAKCGVSVQDEVDKGFSDALKGTHELLDWLGMIPVVGVVFDIANAGLYAAEGNYLMAGLSAVSAIPGIGDAAGLAKIGTRLGKEAGESAVRRLTKRLGITGDELYHYTSRAGARAIASTGIILPTKHLGMSTGKVFATSITPEAMKRHPWLRYLLGLPKYRTEWAVNISR
jgi:RHS repeat-associated protein